MSITAARNERVEGNIWVDLLVKVKLRDGIDGNLLMRQIADQLGVQAALEVCLFAQPTRTSLKIGDGHMYLNAATDDGDIVPQVLAVRQAVEVLGPFADQIVGDWHIKHDYNRSTGKHDPQILNIDDFPKDASLRHVVAQFLSYKL